MTRGRHRSELHLWVRAVDIVWAALTLYRAASPAKQRQSVALKPRPLSHHLSLLLSFSLPLHLHLSIPA